MRFVSMAYLGFALLFWAAGFGTGWTMGPTPTPTVSATDLQKEQLELEKMKLENEKLKLEVEKLKLQASATFQPTPVPTAASLNDQEKKDAVDSFQHGVSKQAGDLSRAHKDEDDILVLDFANSECWFKGVPYNLHEIFTMAGEQKLPLKKTLDGRLNSGVPRYLYQIHNLTLLRYESRERGIVEIFPPVKEGDFKILTPEGITFDSNIGDLRNAYQSLYFEYDGQGERQGNKTIRYHHGRGLFFADKLEFMVDKDGKIKSIRYGVLDEH